MRAEVPAGPLPSVGDATRSRQAESVTPLRADEIGWDLGPSPWPSSARLLAVVVELLPTIQDDLAADLVVQLALALVERDEQVRSIREVKSVTLDELHRTERDNRRLRERVIELSQALRRRAA